MQSKKKKHDTSNQGFQQGEGKRLNLWGGAGTHTHTHTHTHTKKNTFNSRYDSSAINICGYKYVSPYFIILWKCIKFIIFKVIL